MKTVKNHVRKKIKKSQAGFSLVEILVVITILAALMGTVAINVMDSQDEAKINQAEIQIRNLEQALDQFKMREGDYPENSEGIARLTQPSGRSQKAIIDEVPLDPWNRDYIYRRPVDGGNRVLILTYGADGKVGGEGVNADISSETIREKNKKK